MKLIRTKLLLNHNHNSAAGFATASHLDFCKYKVRCLKSEPEWSFAGYRKIFSMFVNSFFVLLLMPILAMTNGLILYPVWIAMHTIAVKKIVKEFGAERINTSAEKLVKEMQEQEWTILVFCL